MTAPEFGLVSPRWGRPATGDPGSYTTTIDLPGPSRSAGERVTFRNLPGRPPDRSSGATEVGDAEVGLDEGVETHREPGKADLVERAADQSVVQSAHDLAMFSGH